MNWIKKECDKEGTTFVSKFSEHFNIRGKVCSKAPDISSGYLDPTSLSIEEPFDWYDNLQTQLPVIKEEPPDDYGDLIETGGDFGESIKPAIGFRESIEPVGRRRSGRRHKQKNDDLYFYGDVLDYQWSQSDSACEESLLVKEEPREEVVFQSPEDNFVVTKNFEEDAQSIERMEHRCSEFDSANIGSKDYQGDNELEEISSWESPVKVEFQGRENLDEKYSIKGSEYTSEGFVENTSENHLIKENEYTTEFQERKIVGENHVIPGIENTSGGCVSEATDEDFGANIKHKVPEVDGTDPQEVQSSNGKEMENRPMGEGNTLGADVKVKSEMEEIEGDAGADERPKVVIENLENCTQENAPNEDTSLSPVSPGKLTLKLKKCQNGYRFVEEEEDDKSELHLKCGINFEYVKIPGKINEGYSCNECGKVFTQFYKFQRHYQIHGDIRPFMCVKPHCFAKFKRREHLYRHLRKVHQCSSLAVSKFHQTKPSTPDALRCKPIFECHVCNVGFMTRGEFKAHNWQHLKNRTCKGLSICLVCCMGFRRDRALKKHHREIECTEYPKVRELSYLRQGRGEDIKKFGYARRNRWDVKLERDRMATEYEWSNLDGNEEYLCCK